MERTIAFIDAEVGIENHRIQDLGAVREDHGNFHSASLSDFYDFISGVDFICGHNVIHHDLKYIEKAFGRKVQGQAIDTLYLSPLLFPKRPYHALLKDEKLQSDELNNPVNDSKKAMSLFYDEVNAFRELPVAQKQIFCELLYSIPEFKGFFVYADIRPSSIDLLDTIRTAYVDKICANVELSSLIQQLPVELAYALALIGTDDPHSITPPWVLKNYPRVENVIRLLCNTPCREGCEYCGNRLDIHKNLEHIFGHKSFRIYDGEPLQERATQAAVEGRSLLAVFPTGGGKSIAFQLPALMAGQTVHGLTVVISPLQSLMKDQVDKLNGEGITEAVAINGLLDPIERANALERIANGSVSLLYIAPEQLRSRTIERLLLSRNVVRFVIDEAHCFSAWGQDFRVDYLYIGDFIRELQKKKGGDKKIPVSCFTATAKQKVISDIRDYFKQKLNLDMELFATSAARENLHYTVLYQETEEEKYTTLRNLIAAKDCSTIVYVSRTRRAQEIADKLCSDGFSAKAFHGQMDPEVKIANQEAFIRDEVKVMVATSAFGMGVDKKDVKLVIHYDISSSLEDYIQEAGRAGRDEKIQAECYVLYNDQDLDRHFLLLNQTKLSISEIQQVWKAIKDLTRQRSKICCSPLEIARQAGWDDLAQGMETRVKTAISALETAGYIKRGQNVPHVYATSILAKDMQEASYRIDQSTLFSEEQRERAKRIIKSLISSRSIAKAGNDDAESRVDYLADILGMEKKEVINCVNLMRQDGLLADSMDMSAYIYASDTENKSLQILERFSRLEGFLLSQLTEEGYTCNLKELNEAAAASGIMSSSVKQLRTLMYYHTIKNYVKKTEFGSSGTVGLVPTMEVDRLTEKYQQRVELCRFILENLYQKATQTGTAEKEERPVLFSLVSLYKEYQESPHLNLYSGEVMLTEVEDALLYLSKIGAMKLEGGFLVLYNGMEIQRIVTDNRIRYKVENYRLLDEFYKQKIRQIHIVGEYANLMVRDYDAALQFVQDYFQMDFQKFIGKYFKDDRAREIDRNITPEKYHQLFGELSDTQARIINDATSRYIVVAAGPGSGKTRVLVHKLAALLLLEDVKHEQLLMLTFSRAAATEFKKRLIALIGSAANYVEIKTFHSYCFDLLGKIGNLDDAGDVVARAAAAIRNGEVEQGKITRNVLVIDEAQDMDESDFALIRALMDNNDDMRLIAVGDDDQNIYGFRGSDSRYLKSLIEDYGATKYEMTENYRSKMSIVSLGNAFAASIQNRMKSAEIEAVQKERGTVMITRHRGEHMEEAVVRHVLETRGDRKCCVLTNTNEEAFLLYSLLQHQGVRSRLIQTMDNLRLHNLVEVRFFLQEIDKGLQSPVISDELWENAKARLRQTYAGSASLEICRNLIDEFAVTNKDKYRSDLEEFIRESYYEDFYSDEGETVYVSTIHKAKGREFDTVYMMLQGNNANHMPEAEKRKLYVGMTRAKSALYIHCNTDLFFRFAVPGIIQAEDHNIYEKPSEISLPLSYKDVVLDFFKDKQKLILCLRSGRKLAADGVSLFTQMNGRRLPVVRFSKACQNKLKEFNKQGYYLCGGEIRFIVLWKGKDDTQEIAIVLPTLYLNRKIS